MSDTFSKVEVFTGVPAGGAFSTEQKPAVVTETMQPGMSSAPLHADMGSRPAWCSAGGS